MQGTLGRIYQQQVVCPRAPFHASIIFSAHSRQVAAKAGPALPTTSLGISPELRQQGGIDPATQPEQSRIGYSTSLRNGFLPVNLDYPGLRILNLDPPVLTVEGFASQELCEQLKETALASNKMQQSKIGGSAVNQQGSDSIRTSTTLAFTREVLDSVPALRQPLDALLERAAQLVQLQALGQDAASLKRTLFTKPSAPGQVVAELPQIARYQPGQHFLSHEDAFPAQVALQKGYQRRATLLVYLNDVPEGGATHFDHLGFGVQPKQGMALLFFPSFSGGMPDARTLHTAVDAVAEKWVFQLWLTSGLPPPPRAQAAAAASQLFPKRGGSSKPKKSRK